jgi:predicted Zn-dependent protease with MMP-like domain
MIEVTDAEFEEMIGKSMDALADKMANVRNVAIILEDEPSEAQRVQLQLRGNETLFGLYEGVPLPGRQGASKTLPDKITLFKIPLSSYAQDRHHLQEEIHHTLWHELAHYFGLNHEDIHARE